MRKNLKTTLLLLTIMAAMCIFVGCGDGKQDDSALPPEPDKQPTEQSADTVGTGNDEEQADSEEQENDAEDGQDGAGQDQPEGEASGKTSNASASDTPDTSADGSDELSVFVESIGDNSVVGNVISMEPSTDGNNIVVMIGEGGGNKKLVSIYFTDDASYVYQLIRDGDVETREGSFSDIGINMILDLTGYYKGEDFYADRVAISDVRDD